MFWLTLLDIVKFVSRIVHSLIYIFTWSSLIWLAVHEVPEHAWRSCEAAPHPCELYLYECYKHQHLEKLVTEAENNDSDKTKIYCRSEKAEILKITIVLWKAIYQEMEPLKHQKEEPPFSQHTLQDIRIHCLIASSCLLLNIPNNLNSEGKSSWLECS